MPLHHEAAVEPVNSNQLVMRALLDDLTVIDHKNLVGMAHSFQPVSDHDDCLIVGQFRNGLHQFLFIFRVDIGSGFVENDDGCVLHNRPGDGDALALTSGKRRAALADDGVKAVRQCHDKVIAARFFRRSLYFLHGCVGLSEADIVGDGVREQIQEVSTMNIKGTKKKNQVLSVNVFEQQEIIAKADAIKSGLKASTWHELETRGKFEKNDKLSFVSDDMLILGCDIGSETHYVRAIDTRGRELSKSAFGFSNTAEGFASMLDWSTKLAAANDKKQIVLGLDPTGHLCDRRPNADENRSAGIHCLSGF